MQGFAPSDDAICRVLLRVQADGEPPDEARKARPQAALLPAQGSRAARQRRWHYWRRSGAL